MPVCLNTDPTEVIFSICTLVTRQNEYEGMVQSFRDAGFRNDCEYLFIDNSKNNVLDAYTACNRFLISAKGRYIVLCHQDVVLDKDLRSDLEQRLADLTSIDPSWGLCGNAGGSGIGSRFARISDPHGEDQKRGPFPARVTSLDENFIVVRREANLALSRDLDGFHLYGTDICLIADLLGWSSWVIDFHLTHKSGGSVDASFHAAREKLILKYRRAFRSRWVTSTCTTMFLTGSYLNLPMEALFQLRRRLRNRK